MILIATRLFSWVSMASTTLPKVPCPKSRTVRSKEIHISKSNKEGKKMRTAGMNHIIWDDNIMALFVIARNIRLLTDEAESINYSKEPKGAHISNSYTGSTVCRISNDRLRLLAIQGRLLGGGRTDLLNVIPFSLLWSRNRKNRR